MSATARVSDLLDPATLRQLLRRRDGLGLLFLAVHCLTLLGTAALLALTWGSFWAIPALFMHGIVIVHLFAPFHECAHSTAFKSAWLNKTVAFWTGIILMLTPLQFRWEHRAHHNYTQQPERDPQMIPMAERLGGYLLYATALPYFYGAISTIIRHALGRFSPIEQQFLPQAEQPKVQRQAWLMIAIYIAIAVISITLQSWNAVIFWLLPRVMGEPFMRLIRMSEHGACPQTDNIWRNTRTVLTWPPIRWLAWNMAYHAEHHAQAAVPFHALPRLHDLLEGRFEVVEQGYWRAQCRLIGNGWRNSWGG
jgi:fatty acid desaturase